MNYWQVFNSPAPRPAVAVADFDAAMPDGSVLRLPLRDLGDVAVAGLIANQASFAVVDQLSRWMAEAMADCGAEIVVGLPTLGHVFGQGVARALGHANWVAPGTTRKFWYEEALSVPTASITAPSEGRVMWLDPRLVGRLLGRRVLLVDDVISTGRSMCAGLALLNAAGVRPVAACVAMAQTQRWREAWPAAIPLRAVFATPLFRRVEGGWRAVKDA